MHEVKKPMQEKTYHHGVSMDGLAILVLLVTYIAMIGGGDPP